MSDAASLDPFLKPAIRAETFRERGVSVPFTTPFLFGARLRDGEDGRAREIVVANPYGGAGVYVLPARNAKDVCSPTVHDRLLLERLEAEPDLSPVLVVRLALALGVQGYAGRLVRRAAEQAHREREVLRESLRGKPSRAATLSSGEGDPAGAEEVLGFRRRLLERLRETVKFFPASAETQGPNGTRAALALFHAGIAVRRGEALLRAIDAIFTVAKGTDDTSVPGRLRMLANELAWILDGWDVVCALWRRAPGRMIVAPFGDLGRLVPVMPPGVAREAGLGTEWETMFRVAEGLRFVAPGLGMRRVDMIAEVERLRAEQWA
jgi:hypothetical protein